MGLAATQVRLLQLTARQHKIEYSAQKIQAQKLQLSAESDAAYTKYMNALDSKKVQYRHIESDGTISYNDATYNSLFNASNMTGRENQYSFEIASGQHAGQILVNSTIANTYNNAINNSGIDQNIDTTLEANKGKNKWGSKLDYKIVTDDEIKHALGSDITITSNNRVNYQKEFIAKLINDKYDTDFSGGDIDVSTQCIQYEKQYIGDTFFATYANFTDIGSADKSSKDYKEDYFNYYSNLYMTLVDSNGAYANDDLIKEKGDSYEWLTNMIENAQLIIHKYNPDGGDQLDGAWETTSLASDTMLAEVENDVEVKKAEATYEAETAYIERKEDKYDTILSQTETERSAIKTEIEELKEVRSKNIEKNFKLFS